MSTISSFLRRNQLETVFHALEKNKGRSNALKALNKNDRTYLLKILKSSKIEHIDWNKTRNIKGHVQKLLNDASKEASSTISVAKNHLEKLPKASTQPDITTPSLRTKQLETFFHALEKNKGRGDALKAMNKMDRTYLLKILKSSKIEHIVWNKTKNIKGHVQKLLKDANKQASGIQSLAKNHLRTVPNPVAQAHLIPFLSDEDLANLQVVSKETAEIAKPTYIIHHYRLAPLIERYCHRDLSNEKQAFKEFKILIHKLCELEKLEPPTYGSTHAFFELIEARNLLRMANKMHAAHPLAGLESKQYEIVKDPKITLQRAEKIRDWLKQHELDLKAFIHLNLNNCGLTLLPIEIGQIGRLDILKSFSAGHNQLVSIPKEIGYLRTVTYVYLSHNQLSCFPKEIYQLTHLTELIICANSLTRIPEGISQLKALKIFAADRNLLTGIPEEIAKIKTLSWLGLTTNRITTIPKKILIKLKALTMLLISNNRLTYIPREIAQLQALDTLRLENNYLSSLPKQIGQMPSLKKEFAIRGNGLVDLPSTLLPYKEQLKEQNKELQMRTMLMRLEALLKKKHNCNEIGTLLDKMEELLGKESCLKLYRNLGEIYKTVPRYRKAAQTPNFGRRAFCDPKMDPKYKIRATKLLRNLYEPV